MILLLAIAIVAGMFWQPQMDRDYRPTPRHEPTKKEIYVKNIDRLIDQKRYDVVRELLGRLEYAKEELPWDYWRHLIHTRLSRIEAEATQLETLRNLERILNG